jgi:hypothetical protein
MPPASRPATASATKESRRRVRVPLRAICASQYDARRDACWSSFAGAEDVRAGRLLCGRTSGGARSPQRHCSLWIAVALLAAADARSSSQAGTSASPAGLPHSLAEQHSRRSTSNLPTPGQRPSGGELVEPFCSRGLSAEPRSPAKPPATPHGRCASAGSQSPPARRRPVRRRAGSRRRARLRSSAARRPGRASCAADRRGRRPCECCRSP